MPESTRRTPGQTAGMLVMFWSWMTIIVVGLAMMIAVPLGGR